MSITYKEIKARLTDLGFEEDDVTESEYNRIFINSLNRAGEILYGTVMMPIEGYLLSQSEPLMESDEITIDLSGTTASEDEHIQPITRITEDTDDDDVIDVPYILIPLYTLLAAHYAWLDDDVVKATLYYNQYDSLKNEIITNANKPRKAQIIGGF